MGITILTHYRIDCDSKNCYESEEVTDSFYTKDGVKSIAEEKGWTFNKNKWYCLNCSLKN